MWQPHHYEASEFNTTVPPPMSELKSIVSSWLESQPFFQKRITSKYSQGWSELARRVVRTGSKSGPNWLAGRSELARKMSKTKAVRTGSRFLRFQKWHTFRAPEQKSQFGPPKVVRTGSNRKSWAMPRFEWNSMVIWYTRSW